MNHYGLSSFSSHDLFRTMIQPAFLGSFLPFAFKKERGKDGRRERRKDGDRERERGRKEGRKEVTQAEEVIKEAWKQKGACGLSGVSLS